MEKPFVNISKAMKEVKGGDIQVAAMLCAARYQRLAGEQATRWEHVQGLTIGSDQETDQESIVLAQSMLAQTTEKESVYLKIVALAKKVAMSEGSLAQATSSSWVCV